MQHTASLDPLRGNLLTIHCSCYHMSVWMIYMMYVCGCMYCGMHVEVREVLWSQFSPSAIFWGSQVTGLMAGTIPSSVVRTVCYFVFLIPLAQPFEKQSDSLKSARDTTAPSSPTCLIAVALTELFLTQSLPAICVLLQC